jgi:hypothetical protein
MSPFPREIALHSDAFRYDDKLLFLQPRFHRDLPALSVTSFTIPLPLRTVKQNHSHPVALIFARPNTSYRRDHSASWRGEVRLARRSLKVTNYQILALNVL